MFAESRFDRLLPLIAVQVVGLVCGIVGVRWSSSIVPPEILGVYGLLVSTHTFAAFVTHQGLVQYTQRHWTPETAGRSYVGLLTRSMVRPTVWLGIGLAAVLAFFISGAGVAIVWTWWGWMLAVNLFALGAHVVHAALQAEQRYWAHFAVSAVASVTRSFLPLLLVLVSNVTLAALGAGFFLHITLWLAAGALGMLRAWRRRDTSTGQPMEPPERMLRAFLGVGLCGWIASNSPRWFAALALTPQTTGFFMLAANLSAVVPAAISLIGVGYTFPPLFAASRAGASRKQLFDMTNGHVAVALLSGQAALFILAWYGPRLVGVVVDAKYTTSMRWLLASGGGALATVSASFYCNLLLAQNRERACFLLLFASTAFRIALLAALALTLNEEGFRHGLSLLAWPTAALEWLIVRHWLRSGSHV